MLNQVRLPNTSYQKFFGTFVVTMIVLMLYWGVSNTKGGVQDRNGALFFLTLNTSFSSLNQVVMVFPEEREIFIREVSNNMYYVSSYFWAKVVSELPSAVIQPILMGSASYFAVGLSTAYWYKFPIFILVLCLVSNAFTGFGYILGTGVENKQVSNVLVPLIVVPTMLVTGFFVNEENVPWFFEPLKWIAIMKYGFQALHLNEYTDIKGLDCLTAENPKDKCDPISDLDSP